MYTHLKRVERKQFDQMYNLTRLVCSFINPGAAETFFSIKPETIENTGFESDLKKLDPNFDPSKYEEMLS